MRGGGSDKYMHFALRGVSQETERRALEGVAEIFKKACPQQMLAVIMVLVMVVAVAL